MTPSPPPTGLLHQSAGTSNVLGSLPSRLVTEDTPPDMLAGSMDLRVTLPNGQTVKMSVERSTPMMDLLVHITTAHKVSPGGHVLQALGERGALPYKPSTPIGALDTWSICVVPRNQALASQQLLASANKRAPPKPLALQPQQPFEQTFRLQVRLPRNQLFVARLSPRTPLLDILEHVCREKNLEAAKYELRHPVNTDQPLQLSLSLADYRLTEVALVPRGSRAPTELSSSDIPALQTRSEETLLVSANSRQQRASNPASSTSTGSGGGGGGIFANMLKRTRSGGGGKEGSVSGDSLGGRSSSPARSDESAGRSVSPPAPRPLSQPQQPPLPTRHRKGRAPKPPSQATTSSNNNNTAANTEPAVVEAPADHILVISHSRNSSDSSGYHEASVLSESPDNHTNDSRRLESPSNGPARGKATKVSKSQQSKQFSRSMSNLSSEASTSTSQPPSQKLSSVHSMSTTSLSKKKRAPAPPPPPSTISEPRQPEPSPSVPPVSSIVLEPESMKEPENLAESCPKDDEDDSAGEDDLDSAFQSVTDVLEEQLRAEEATALRKLAEDKAVEDETERQRSSPEVSVEDAEELARSEAKKHEEWLRAEEERRKAEDERRRIEEERARLAQEREELARQKREQYALELELRERLQRELEEKQRAMQLEQRREIERLQKEQEELEKELKEKELEKLQRLKAKPALEIQLTEQEITDIPDWEYKLPAPPSAFRDKQVELTDMKQNEENEERQSSLWSTNSEEVATKNKINIMLETAKDSDEGMETRPKPPEVVELRVKPTVLCEPAPRSLSPPRITVLPLRSAHSLYSLVQADEDSLKITQGEKVGQNLRKTSSVADVSATAAAPPASSDLGDDEEQRLQQLQQQCIQWQEQLLTNQSVLQGHVSMPLQSLQVLREILPQMKQKLSEDASEKNDAVTLRSSTLPRTPRPVSASIVPLESGSSTTLDRRTTPAPVSQQRYRPPTVNLGTWSERPKSEVSIKQDSDYRIGFGQYQHTAARAPVVRSAEPKLKDTTNLIAGGAINRELVTRSNSWRVTPSTPLHKPSMVVIQNTTTTTTTTEQVRASNKPTVILRHQPLSLSDLPTQQRRYTTLVGINGAPQPSQQQQQQANSNQQRINITQTSNPVVKGFKIETTAANPIPIPPPPVIRNVTQKRVSKPPPVQANNGATDRDHLMDAIRNFGGRSNLRKTRSMQL